jgi:hypothetical protein
MHYVSACITLVTVLLVLLMHVAHVFTQAISCIDSSFGQSEVPHCTQLARTNCTQICSVYHIAPGSHLCLSYDMLQARQYIILSITVSHRNHDIDPTLLLTVLSVLVRYTTGVFSDTINAVTQDSPTQLWAAVSLERGLTNNRLHVQGASLVRFDCECACSPWR